MLKKILGAALGVALAGPVTALTIAQTVPVIGGPSIVDSAVDVIYEPSLEILEVVNIDATLFAGGSISMTGSITSTSPTDLDVYDSLTFTSLLDGSLEDTEFAGDELLLLYATGTDVLGFGPYALVTLTFAKGDLGDPFDPAEALAVTGLVASLEITGVTPIPLPATALMLGGALLGLGRTARSRA